MALVPKFSLRSFDSVCSLRVWERTINLLDHIHSAGCHPKTLLCKVTKSSMCMYNTKGEFFFSTVYGQ